MKKIVAIIIVALLFYGTVKIAILRETKHTSSILNIQVESQNTQEKHNFPALIETYQISLADITIKHFPRLNEPNIEVQEGGKEYYFRAGTDITIAIFNVTFRTSTSEPLLLPRWSHCQVTVHDGSSINDSALVGGSMPVWTLVNGELFYKITLNLRPLIENDGPGTNRTLAVSIFAFGGISPFYRIAKNLFGFKELSRNWQITVNFVT